MRKLIKIKYLIGAVLCSSLAGLAVAAPVNNIYLALSQEQGKILWLQTSPHAAIQTFNGQTGALEQTVALALKPDQLLMGFTPDGFKVALLESAGLSILHRTGKTLRTLAVPNLPQPVTSYQPANAITNATGTAQLFHDAKANKLQVIHTGSGKLLASVDLPKSRLLALGLNANMHKLAYVTQGTADKADLQIYDLFKNTLLKTYTLNAPSPFRQPMVFSKDGKYVALLPQVLNLETSELIMVKDATGLAVFTENNQALLFASQQGVQRFDLATKQQQLMALNLPKQCQTMVVTDISADQQNLAFAGQCNNDAKNLAVVALLDAKTGQWQRNINLLKP